MGWKDPLEKEMATRSSLLAWRGPRTEEPGEVHGQRSLAGSSPWGHRVGHDLGTKQLWGQNKAGCVNSLEQGWDTGLKKRWGLLASSLSVSQGHRWEESQAPWTLPPTFQVDPGPHPRWAYMLWD